MKTTAVPDTIRSIEVLSKCRFIFKWTNLYNPNGFYIGQTKIPDALVTLLLSSQIMGTGVLYFLYCYDHEFDSDSISGTFPYVIGTTQMTLVYVSLAMRNRVIVAAIRDLQKVVTERIVRSLDCHEIYWKCEKAHITVMDRFLKISIGFIAVAYGPHFFMPIFYGCFGLPSRDDWKLPLQAREFMDRKTYCGFYVLWVNLLTGGIFYFIFLTVSLGLYISLCLYTEAIVTDFRKVLAKFDEQTTAKQKTYPILSEAIQLHSDMFNLMNNIQNIMSGVLFYQLLSCILFLALSFLFVDNAERIDTALILNFQCLIMYMTVCYLYCDLSEKITANSFEINMIVYKSLWYESTPKHRRALVLTIMRSQKDFRLKGYGLVNCSLPRFLMIIRASISYYLVFRQMNRM